MKDYFLKVELTAPIQSKLNKDELDALLNEGGVELKLTVNNNKIKIGLVELIEADVEDLDGF